MTIIHIADGALEAKISTAGAIVLGLWSKRIGEKVPLLRESPSDTATALQSGCYPLVPFGNRVKDNRFDFGGRDYAFAPNTDWDPHYLHGEGWQSEWTIIRQTESMVELGFSHAGGCTPYVYQATQTFVLADSALSISMSVTNRGEDPLPFGLGWHPYFPMTPLTTLMAPARKYWTEVEGWLPGEAIDIPEDVDFSRPRGLPHRWVNNGFEEWNGEAEIVWPEREMRLTLTADPLFRHAFVFVSDTVFDPSFQRDYFCFEPMSHLANGHNLPGIGGLTVLKTGETLAGGIRLQPDFLA